MDNRNIAFLLSVQVGSGKGAYSRLESGNFCVGKVQRSLHNLRLNSGDILQMAFSLVHHLLGAAAEPGEERGG